MRNINFFKECFLQNSPHVAQSKSPILCQMPAPLPILLSTTRTGLVLIVEFTKLRIEKMDQMPHMLPCPHPSLLLNIDRGINNSRKTLDSFFTGIEILYLIGLLLHKVVISPLCVWDCRSHDRLSCHCVV